MPEPSPWPASSVFGEAGLAVAGVGARELADRFATPLLVFDLADVRERMRTMRGAFSDVAYAVKAFTGHAMVRLAHQEGLDLLCSSGGEVEACLRAGVPAGAINLHGNAKTDAELRLAVQAGIGLVIADGPEELARLDAIAEGAGREVDVMLRVRPGVEADTHEKIATGHEESKFGVTRGEVAAPPVGSQILEAGPALATLEVLVSVAREAGFVPRVLDVGGGFGVTYVDEDPVTPQVLAAALAGRLEVLAGDAGWPMPALAVEPGRWLVANPACTLYTVLARKRAGGRDLLAVDGGMSDNLRPMLYDAVHAVALASRGSGAAEETVTVVGRHCESGDVLARDVSLPAGVEPGDLIAVAATGAYSYPLASAYNRFGRPAVVAVQDAEVIPWLRREDAGDMDRLEIAPRRREPEAAPAGVQVRPARPADARAFLAHWSEIVQEGGSIRTERVAAAPAQVRRRFKRSWGPEDANVLAMAGADVVGHIGLSRERHPATRHVATFGMAVSPGFRRRGVGEALLAAGFRWAREQGVAKIVLSVFPDNTAAIALYRGLGFVEEGRLAGHAWTSSGPRDEILMAAWVDGEDR
ncbi:MAG: diaminopimelate decarboxylase [Actinomycetota bacterium]